jgi:hypothetical protein
MNVKIFGAVYKFDVLGINYYSDERERISVVIRYPKKLGGRVEMLCRGHVSSMRTALNMNDTEYELMDVS